ncbi:cilia- and flagella-associated protein 184 [Embiotoca jacksoni]|uniref:cilia- and flagella-associated protein 184 n=1 Tax=Embiotoca jacksoni TaxID=100190 RepID=UPI0037048119
MDRESEHEGNEVKNDTERETSEEDEDEEEEEPEERSGDDVLGAGGVDEEPDVRADEVGEQPPSREASVALEVNCTCDDGARGLRGEEEEEAEGREAPDGDGDDTGYGEYARLLRGLSEERAEACRRSGRLQTTLSEHFRGTAGDEAPPERPRPAREQLQEEYDEHVSILTGLKQQLREDSEAARQRAEDLRLQSQDKLDEVDNEWRALMALKREAAVAALSRRLGKEAARSEAESALTAEQLRQDELIELRLKHIGLTTRIRRLEAELRDGEEQDADPLQVQFQRLRAARLERRKRAEKQSEEASKLQKKISSCLELLSNVKEKLCWSQAEVRAKRAQLAEAEAAAARRRDLLTRTERARGGLRRDNQRLKERRGLLGDRVLLRDFEDTADASDRLEEQLENLKCRRAEVAFGRGRRKKRLGHDLTN